MLKLCTAKIIADSISEKGKRITTFELEYPRIIHSELMTHRVFSRNAMSSRAVPVGKMLQQIVENPAMPVRFGVNKRGMEDGGEHDQKIRVEYTDMELTPEEFWKEAAKNAAWHAEKFALAGYHKQVCNRLVEPFQRMKTVVTSTEWNNFFHLRCWHDADPTIQMLANCMWDALMNSTPETLKPGQWHTPYVEHVYLDGEFNYAVRDTEGKLCILDTKEALSISASCCAQVSYRNIDSTFEKADSVAKKLIGGDRIHASPYEHQATPMDHDNAMERLNYYLSSCEITQDSCVWQEGVTHQDRDGKFWSANFCGWVQHRQLLNNHFIKG
ncbi:putative thymidylate synthase [Escherichia phage vB_EcoM_366V_SA_NWU]|nr:putative thymidylate synthase [Escherichia phage vB_EcoM_10C2_SA_NWU]WIL79183.1 putative thymidylate synthase [Escherichia phage vB_EcoM_12A_SA_NWU]WIL79760.1 putative thymidylate synthase [Escherichia phage vB_EcoM_366V_SA_NWU]